MQTIVRGGPRDLIALAWYQIGFRPRESLVFVGLRGRRRRTGIVVRVDLPAPQDRARALHDVVRLLSRADDTEVVVLVVSDVEGGPRGGPAGAVLMPHRELVAWLRDELDQQGLAVFDVLAVGPTTFRSYLCDGDCCPAVGQSLDEVADSELAAHMVLQGRAVLDCEQDLVADVRPDADGGLTRAALRRLPRPDPGQLLREWRELLAAGASQPPDPGRFVLAMRDLRVRDALMFTLIPGSALVPERVLAGDVVGTDPATEGLWGNYPDAELAERGRRLLAAVARVAPAGDRAQPLSVLAWLAWWCNDAARCRLLVDLALADRPGHRLSGLVAQLLAAGIPPTWWRQKPA